MKMPGSRPGRTTRRDAANSLNSAATSAFQKNRKVALVVARAKTSSQGQNCGLTDHRRDPQSGTFGMICRYKSMFNAAQSADVMRYLATILIVLVTAPSWANERDSILQQAEALGAPCLLYTSRCV